MYSTEVEGPFETPHAPALLICQALVCERILQKYCFYHAAFAARPKPIGAACPAGAVKPLLPWYQMLLGQLFDNTWQIHCVRSQLVGTLFLKQAVPLEPRKHRPNLSKAITLAGKLFECGMSFSLLSLMEVHHCP